MNNAISIDKKTQQGWIALDSIKDAAEYLGVSQSFLSVCLRKDKPCLGFALRPHQDDDVIFTRQRQAYKESCQEFDKKLMDWFETHSPRSLTPNPNNSLARQHDSTIAR